MRHTVNICCASYSMAGDESPITPIHGKDGVALQRVEDNLGVTVAIPKGVLIFQVGWHGHEGILTMGKGPRSARCSRRGPPFICSTWVLTQPLNPSKKQDSMTREPFL